MTNKVFFASTEISFQQLKQEDDNFFHRSDISFSTFNSGKTLLEEIKNKNPDLIIIDRDLADVKGDKICFSVKNDTELRNIPIIIILSDEKSETLERCLLSGCDDYLLKPIDIKKLTDKIARLLRIPFRKDLRILFRFWLKGEKLSEFFFGNSEDISISGMLFSSDVALQKDDIIEVTFFLPLSTTKISMTCKIVRIVKSENSKEYRYGIQFLKMEEMNQHYLRDYLEKQRAKPLT